MQFTSYNGVDYYYDDGIGISFPAQICQDYGETNESGHTGPSLKEKSGKKRRYQERYIQKLKKIRSLQSPIDTGQENQDTIVDQLFRHGLLQMILGVTEECNLACRYCVFSDVYTNTRNSSPKKMTFQTAKKALDYYMQLLEEGKRYNPVRDPSLGFYGGEPLLNFDLIRDTVTYLNSAYPDERLSYHITTNGTLLTGEIIDFLMKNKFSISISLDGPQSEHDRNRVYANGKGTFTDVMKNIRKLTDLHYEKIQILTVFDIHTNFSKLQKFFNQENIPKLSNVTMPNKCDGCSYYDQFSEQDYQKYKDMEYGAFQDYLSDIKNNRSFNSFYDHIYGVYSYRIIYQVSTLIDRSSYLIPYTGTCIPGRKIFVDTDGLYHICERINQTFPIGDIHNGLDFQKITTILHQYRKNIDECRTCNSQKTCAKCFSSFALNGTFKDPRQECKNVRKNSENDHAQAFSICEISPSFLSNLADDYYSWLSKVSSTLGD